MKQKVLNYGFRDQTTFMGIIVLNRMTVAGHASVRIIRAVRGVQR